MTDLETFIAFTLIFVPALIFWICTISYVANEIFDFIELNKQIDEDYIFDCYGYAHKKEDLPPFPPQTFSDLRAWEETGVLDEYLKRDKQYVDGAKDECDSYLKRNSDYRDAKFKYVEDKLNDYLNTDEATVGFQKIFSTINVSHDFRKKVWLAHLDEKRIEFETDFDNL